MNEEVRYFSSNMRHLVLELLITAAAVLLAIFTLQLTGCATAGRHGTESTAGVESIEERWGIQITGIRQTAAGHMLDFRYRVVDSDKARPLFLRQTKPYLIDQASGKVLAVPTTAKVGPLRTSDKPREGRIYWMFFANPGVVKAGSKVTVVIGDFKAEDLTVE